MTLNNEITKKLLLLDGYETKLINYSRDMMVADGGKIFLMDVLAIGVINRSISLINGFATLIRSENYMAAVHLVRLHLDSYLRFSAVWRVTNINEFVQKVLEGVKISSIKDSDNKQMTDKYLVEKASSEYPWMENVYNNCSGFVHLSGRHLLTSGKVSDLEKRVMEFRVYKKDVYVNNELRIEAALGMIEITEAILQLLVSWIYTKSNPLNLK